VGTGVRTVSLTGGRTDGSFRVDVRTGVRTAAILVRVREVGGSNPPAPTDSYPRPHGYSIQGIRVAVINREVILSGSISGRQKLIAQPADSPPNPD
jgi:hypothetical protein